MWFQSGNTTCCSFSFISLSRVTSKFSLDKAHLSNSLYHRGSLQSMRPLLRWPPKLSSNEITCGSAYTQWSYYVLKHSSCFWCCVCEWITASWRSCKVTTLQKLLSRKIQTQGESCGSTLKWLEERNGDVTPDWWCIWFLIFQLVFDRKLTAMWLRIRMW